MRCLTYSECARWCSLRESPLRQSDGYSVGAPDLKSPPSHFIKFKLPTNSGRKVAFGHFLYSLVDPAPELLLWLDDWDVWPSSAHMPLFTRFRDAHGESRL